MPPGILLDLLLASKFPDRHHGPISLCASADAAHPPRAEVSCTGQLTGSLHAHSHSPRPCSPLEARDFLTKRPRHSQAANTSAGTRLSISATESCVIFVICHPVWTFLVFFCIRYPGECWRVQHTTWRLILARPALGLPRRHRRWRIRLATLSKGGAAELQSCSEEYPFCSRHEGGEKLQFRCRVLVMVYTAAVLISQCTGPLSSIWRSFARPPPL